ncbi:DsbA family protein [Arcanobacterium hippocoleae]|uniref:Protein-disulfide isomerase n=1 Tax=Arcanobacterium hippocoleae TaxID=149017 RepID=A0ABU1T2S4_9ACTO|nr:thioredoxin domain-containing protein [Arcanobacterium hippocoleae]MDR6939604.1 protein-disulfide isomerase [Arcanobacterium hippocoleae]
MTQENSYSAVAPAAAQQNKTSKILIIALIVLAMVATVFATLFFTSQANPGANQKQRAQTQTAQADQPGSATQNGTQPGAGENQQPTTAQPVSPEAKQAIDAQHRLDPKDPMAKGDVNAPVVIEVYADFRCGHCINYTLNTEPELESRIAAGEIRYEFNSLPVLGPDSTLAAYAAQAAANQNKFWEYHNELFKLAASGNAAYNDATFNQLAQKVGIKDLAKFTADMKSPDTAQKVAADSERAQQLGINGTPSFLIGYSYLPGSVDTDTLNHIIDLELKR